MPKLSPREAITTRIRPLIRRPATSGTVLVVTDSTAAHDEIVAALEVDGYLVAIATDTVDAITQLRSGGAPSLVIVDLDLPDLAGWNLMVELAADDRLAAVPVVAISATLRIDPRQRPVMAKPIDLGALRDVLAIHGGVVRPGVR